MQHIPWMKDRLQQEQFTYLAPEKLHRKAPIVEKTSILINI